MPKSGRYRMRRWNTGFGTPSLATSNSRESNGHDMFSRIAADLVLVLHLAFIAFAVLGALLVLRYRRTVYIHVPAATWGTFVEITGRICPLTTLENHLRRNAGEAGYIDSFIEHYLVPLIYPAGLTRDDQIWIAGIVAVANIVIYGWLLYRWKKFRATEMSF